MTNLHSHPREFNQEELLDRLRDFHGHLGPFAILGYRAGVLALRELNASTHFGLHATVRCPDEPPPSCFVDGVQYGTGCTLGKRNIELIPAETISVTVTRNDSGAALTIVPRREMIDTFSSWLDEMNTEQAALDVLELPDAELFEPLE